jgi:RNA polymerase sigma-70 factor (ECF subfamily)
MNLVALAEERVTDAEAIERSLAEPAAFVAIFERHFGLLHRYLQVRAGAGSADDLAAQTFEIAFRRRADYDVSRADARAWLFGIALNLVRELRRSEGRQQRALARLSPREGDVDPSFDQVDARASGTALWSVLMEVPEEERDLLLLFACVDLSYEECADALGIPVGTVRSRLHRLRARLRARLAPERRPPQEDER